MSKDVKKYDSKKAYIPTGSQNFSNIGLGLPISQTASYEFSEKFLPFDGYYRGEFIRNNYPEILRVLYKQSPTHGTAIKVKNKMTKGRGFNMDLLDDNVKKFLNNINEDGQTINDLLGKVSLDYVLYGGFSLKVYWNGEGQICYIEHIPFGKVRVGYPNERGKVEYYIISNNWTKNTPTDLEHVDYVPKFNPKYFEGGVRKIRGIAEPTEEQSNNACQLLYYISDDADNDVNSEYYPQPDYIHGADAIVSEIDMIISEKAVMKNGIGGKYLVTFPSLNQTEEEKMQNINKIIYNFTNVEENGGIVCLYGDGETTPQLDKLEALDADTYAGVNDRMVQRIVTAHNIPPILLEYNYGGGFNNRAQELQVAFESLQLTTIRSYQDEIIKVFKKLLRYSGFEDVELDIVPFVEPTNIEGSEI